MTTTKLLKKSSIIWGLVLTLLVIFRGETPAQMKAYGSPINLEIAKKAAASAIAEARKNNWSMAVAITDTAGELVYFEKIDGTMTASVKVAMSKARSAALFKRPTKVWQDLVAGGNLFILGLEGAVTLDGGLPLVVDDKIVGAIGVSGGTTAQDGQVATAGAQGLAAK